jgi:hypothetical protein
MNALVGELLAQAGVQAHTQGMANISMAGQNLAQGLGVVNTSLIHQQGAVSDDPGLIAALQTASRVPIQGANDLAK